MLGRKKLIAEPWDVGPDGYRLGGFPQPFAEWNDRFRDCVRRFWRGDEGDRCRSSPPGSSARPTSSRARGRPPQASINLVTSHDGFTLADLVAYERRHNEANGEANRDGHAREPRTQPRRRGTDRRSRDPAPRATGTAATCWPRCFLAQGTPMLLMGDELGRTQQGNNNAYCQDNPISWCDWGESTGRSLAFVRRLARLRRGHPVLRRRAFPARPPARCRWPRRRHLARRGRRHADTRPLAGAGPTPPGTAARRRRRPRSRRRTAGRLVMPPCSSCSTRPTPLPPAPCRCCRR